MSSLNSVSNIGVSSTKADKPPDDKARSVEGSEQSFGDLFGRVFGESSVRQGSAAKDGHDQQSSLRTVFIGSETQVITAGQPPTEEEILSFAREANLDETSVQALLLTIPGGSLTGMAGLSGHKSNDPSLVGEEHVSDLLLTKDGLKAQAAINQTAEETELMLTPHFGTEVVLTGSLQELGSGKLAEATQFVPTSHLSTEGLPTGAAKEISSAKLAETLGLNTKLESQLFTAQDKGLLVNGSNKTLGHGAAASSGLFSVSVKPVGLGSQESSQSALEVLASRADAQGDDVPEDILAGRLGLSPKDFAKKQLFEGLAIKAGHNELLLKSSPAVQLESIDLSGLQPSEIDTLRGPMAEVDDEPPSLSSSLHSSLDAGGRSSGGSGEGSPGRPDQLAQQPGRALSQQVLQRFGELLGQRLLQQIGQGNWRVEIALEPADLGSIQIELEWRKGALEASFKASQAVTRELLQEGLPRLREVLERAGIDVASVYVNDHGRQQSFQDRSGGGSAENGLQFRQSDSVNEVEEDETGSKIGKLENGRLDVLV